MKKLYSIFVVAVGMLVLPAIASAADDPYGSVAGVTGGGGTGDVTSGGNAAASTGGGLPFTGLEIGIVLLAGIALLATGLLLRRRSASQL